MEAEKALGYGVAVSTALLSASYATGLAEYMGLCGDVCRVFSLLSRSAALLVAAAVAAGYAAARAPYVYAPLLAYAAGALGLVTGPPYWLLMGFSLGVLASGAAYSLRADETTPGTVARSIVAVAGLPLLLVSLAQIMTVVGLGVPKLLAEAVNAFTAPVHVVLDKLPAAPRLDDALLTAVYASLHPGVAAPWAGYTALEALGEARGGAPAALPKTLGLVMALLSLVAALAVQGEEEIEERLVATLPLRAEGPAGRETIEPVAARPRPRAEQLRVAIQPRRLSGSCRIALKAFIDLVRAGGAEWRRFFDTCIRGTSVYGYVIEDTIGVGADGIVFKARDEDTGEPAAVKIILPEPVKEMVEDSRRALSQAFSLIESLEREGASLRELSSKSPYIVRVKAIHTDAEKFKLAIRKNSFEIYIKNPPSIIMEYMAGGSSESMLQYARPGNTAWQRAASALIAVAAEALRVVHENGYVHSDVKPANILLTAEPPAAPEALAKALCEALQAPDKAHLVPKLSDLGVAARKGERLKGFTPLYAAPEVLVYERLCTTNPASPECIKASTAHPSQDIYSLGLIALQFYTGASKKMLSSWRTLLNTEPSAAETLLEGKADKETIEIVKRMLSTRPEERPTAAEVAAFFRRKALQKTG